MDQSISTEDIVRLIYRSHSDIPRESMEKELGDILLAARRNNKSKGVTGALMYYDGRFAQALEGPDDAVRAIFEKIQTDRRHKTVAVVSDGKVASRVFSRWAMASVGEHGDPDTPLIAHGNGVGAAEDWKTTPEQEAVLTVLRDATRGYGRGA